MDQALNVIDNMYNDLHDKKDDPGYQKENYLKQTSKYTILI